MIPTERPVVPFPNMVPTEPTAGLESRLWMTTMAFAT
jgi:hypothetical protein